MIVTCFQIFKLFVVLSGAGFGGFLFSLSVFGSLLKFQPRSQRVGRRKESHMKMTGVLVGNFEKNP